MWVCASLPLPSTLKETETVSWNRPLGSLGVWGKHTLSMPHVGTMGTSLGFTAEGPYQYLIYRTRISGKTGCLSAGVVSLGVDSAVSTAS